MEEPAGFARGRCVSVGRGGSVGGSGDNKTVPIAQVAAVIQLIVQAADGIPTDLEAVAGFSQGERDVRLQLGESAGGAGVGAAREGGDGVAGDGHPVRGEESAEAVPAHFSFDVGRVEGRCATDAAVACDGDPVGREPELLPKGDGHGVGDGFEDGFAVRGIPALSADGRDGPADAVVVTLTGAGAGGETGGTGGLGLEHIAVFHHADVKDAGAGGAGGRELGADAEVDEEVASLSGKGGDVDHEGLLPAGVCDGTVEALIVHAFIVRLQGKGPEAGDADGVVFGGAVDVFPVDDVCAADGERGAVGEEGADAIEGDRGGRGIDTCTAIAAAGEGVGISSRRDAAEERWRWRAAHDPEAKGLAVPAGVGDASVEEIRAGGIGIKCAAGVEGVRVFQFQPFSDVAGLIEGAVGAGLRGIETDRRRRLVKALVVWVGA